MYHLCESLSGREDGHQAHLAEQEAAIEGNCANKLWVGHLVTYELLTLKAPALYNGLGQVPALLSVKSECKQKQ